MRHYAVSGSRPWNSLLSDMHEPDFEVYFQTTAEQLLAYVCD